jgi:hypothetical protein
MPRAEEEAIAVADELARNEDGSVDGVKYYAIFKEEYHRRLAERQERLLHDTRAVFRSMDGWANVKDEDAWRDVVRQAADDLESSEFLINRLGAERYLDPELMATLLVLRRSLIDEYGAESAANLMLIDVAVLSYYHTIRINGWIGNFATMLEAEFFGTEPLRLNYQGKSNTAWELKVRRLDAEDIVHRIGEQLVPLLDRSNRMMIRNLKTLDARRQRPTPNVSIGSAGQVNVGAQQINTTGACDWVHQAEGAGSNAVGKGRRQAR